MGKAQEECIRSDMKKNMSLAEIWLASLIFKPEWAYCRMFVLDSSLGCASFHVTLCHSPLQVWVPCPPRYRWGDYSSKTWKLGRDDGWNSSEEFEGDEIDSVIKYQNCEYSDWQETQGKLELQKRVLHGADDEGCQWGGEYPPWHATYEEYLQAHKYVTFFYVTINEFLYSRSSKFNHFGDNLKCFHNPERVLLVHNHLPLSCIKGECTSYPTTTNVAYLHHHRQTCPQSLRKICKEEFMMRTERDTTMWRWREYVMGRVGDSLKNIGLNQLMK